MSDGPFLTPREQVEHSISKGITFNNITEAESEQYLNNYGMTYGKIVVAYIVAIYMLNILKIKINVVLYGLF